MAPCPGEPGLNRVIMASLRACIDRGYVFLCIRNILYYEFVGDLFSDAKSYEQDNIKSVKY
jgi:hypothetical protein